MKLPRWTHEPLVHFVAIGCALFALDAALGARRVDLHTIVVGPEIDERARRIYEAAAGREPDQAELLAMRRSWAESEMLYREGLTLGLDKGDEVIRARVIQNTLSLLHAAGRPAPQDDRRMRAWVEESTAEQRAAAVRTLAGQYRIVTPPR